jgi:AhpD family alkylhydroperoxidase
MADRAPEPAPGVDLLEVNDADFVAGFEKLYAQTRGEGAVPTKYKELMGVAPSVVIRCEPCLSYHIKKALAEKATKAEFVEAIRIGILSAGSATMPTARHGYRVLRELGVL